jgi:hypothetical protein
VMPDPREARVALGPDPLLLAQEQVLARGGPR